VKGFAWQRGVGLVDCPGTSAMAAAGINENANTIRMSRSNIQSSIDVGYTPPVMFIAAIDRLKINVESSRVPIPLSPWPVATGRGDRFASQATLACVITMTEGCTPRL